MIHTIDEQKLFDVPVPKATETYSPVPHRQIVDYVEESLGRYNVGIANKSYRANAAGTQLIGTFDLDQRTASKDFAYRLTFKNSYDKSMSVGFSAGAVVLVCSNGMMVSTGRQESYRRKHTGGVLEELKEKMETTFREFAPVMKKSIAQAEQMKTIEVDTKLSAELAGRMLIEQEIINATQLMIIKKEIHTPTYGAFTEPTLWSFYNHVTHALKHAHPTRYIEQHRDFHTFVEQNFSL